MGGGGKNVREIIRRNRINGVAGFAQQISIVHGVG